MNQKLLMSMIASLGQVRLHVVLLQALAEKPVGWMLTSEWYLSLMRGSRGGISLLCTIGGTENTVGETSRRTRLRGESAREFSARAPTLLDYLLQNI